MIRTAIILSSIILFVTWYVHVINRASNGSGFRRDEFRKDVAYSGVVAGSLFVLMVTWSLAGVYVWHVRDRQVSIVSVLGPPFLIWTAFCLVAFAVGVVLAETYCAVDEYVFQRQLRQKLATATPDSVDREEEKFSRVRWWPADGERFLKQ